MDKRSRRAEFRKKIEGMSTEQLRKLSEVLRRSTDDVIEEVIVIEEHLRNGSPAPEPSRSRIQPGTVGNQAGTQLKHGPVRNRR